MDAPPSYEQLLELEPELRNLEATVVAVQDQGGVFFCANNAWFAIKERLAQLLGIWRREQPGESEEAARILADGRGFEMVFERLYPLLPPCRDCGCQLFEPHRQ